jgi:hypothetical protein
MMHISSIAELVDFFGGDTALAAKLDISQSAVAHWKLRKQIAAGWHLRLMAEINRQGATVSPEVFGLDQEEIEALGGSKKKRPPRRPTRRAEARVA